MPLFATDAVLLRDEPFVPGGQGALALDAMAFFFVADFFAEIFFEGWEEVEGDVGRLEFFGFGVRDVVGERAVGAQPGRGHRSFAVCNRCGVDAG